MAGFGYTSMGYGSPPSAADRPLTEAERQALLAQAGQQGGGLLEDLAWYADLPGSFVRGTLAGDPLSAFSSDIGDRVDGRELLRQYGLLDPNADDTWGNFGAGFAAEVLLDPLSYVGIGGLTKAGKLARNANLLERVPEFLSKQYIAGRAAPEVAERASSALAKMGRQSISPTEVAARPLIGRRAAQRLGTLEDILPYTPDPAAARAKLAFQAGGEDALEGLMRQPLGKSAGYGLPLGDLNVAFDLPGFAALGDALDAAGQRLRWSLPGRFASALTNDAFAGSLDEEVQMVLGGADIAKQDAVFAATKEASMQQARMLAGSGSIDGIRRVMSEEGNRVLGRLIEQPGVNKFSAQDAKFLEESPAMRQYAEWWKERANQFLDESARAGIGSDRFADDNISGYLPRVLGSPLEIAGERSPTLGRQLSTLTPDQMHRTTAMMVPGGRDTIAFELSRDPYLVPIVAGKRGALSEAEAVQYIMNKVSGVGSKQAKELARILERLPGKIVEKAPLFGDHPAEMITKYMQRRSGAISNAKSLVESLAYRAVDSPIQSVQGAEPMITAKEALKRLGLESTEIAGEQVGAQANLRKQLSALLGKSADQIELSQVSVPESFVNKILTARTMLTNPGEAASFVSRMNNAYMVMFKAGVLTWPSRYVRDVLSGGISNWLEGAASARGYAAAISLMRKSAFDPEFATHLRKIPLYAGKDPQTAVAEFYSDLYATNLIDSAKHVDIDTSGMREASKFVGLQEPAGGILPPELLPKAGGSWRDWNPIDPRTYNSRANPTAPTTNRFALMGMRYSELTDRLNRLSGYLELLMQGVDPQQAAMRIKRAQVDYSSLSRYERQLRDTIWPFYAYQSRIMREVLRQLAERPGGKYGQMLRLKTRNDEAQEDGMYVPEYLRDQWAIPLGENEDGSQSYISNFDVPGIDALGLIDTDGGVQGTARNLAMQASPYMRVAAEQAFGRDLLTSRPLEDIPGSGVTQIADLVPWASRPFRAVKQVRDNGPAKAAVQNFTGVKFTNLRDDQVLSDAYRLLLDDMGADVRTMEIPYIPSSLEPSMSMQQRSRLENLKRLQAESRRLRQSGSGFSGR
jgi:hypothetical protein